MRIGPVAIDHQRVRLSGFKNRPDLFTWLQPALDPAWIEEQEREPPAVARPELLVQLQKRVGHSPARGIQKANVRISLTFGSSARRNEDKTAAGLLGNTSAEGYTDSTTVSLIGVPGGGARSRSRTSRPL